MKFVSANGLAFIVMIASLSFSLSSNSQELKEYKAGRKTISVASYNAENLFDEKHDEGKNDWTYLPLKIKRKSPKVKKYCERLRNYYYRFNCLNLDWSLENLEGKLRNLGRVIKKMDRGRSPDIIVLQEVENFRVLKMLRDVALKGEGYKEIVLIEGPDSRGIDVGILSKFPLAKKAKIHHVDLAPHFPRRPNTPQTRPILDATFDIGKTKLRVLGNHWPSQSHDDETREIAAQTLYDAVKYSRYPTVALGDFNTHPSDRPHGINLWIHDRSSSRFFFDAEREAYREPYPLLKSGNRGTHHYQGKWTSLDKIFVLENSFKRACSKYSTCLRPIWSSFQIVKKSFMLHDVTFRDPETGDEVTYYDVPKRFDAESGEGYSDHLPVVLRIEVK
ncbi:MAG: hypothetical protein CME70_03620 [Halobacteriovorax sp.]|nr:hypothetical protein [Halobacteriovorax sp.]|tara:strand:+ start:200418 stop:201587 length:1170 start_codon:yes stop_codon:yes gene_type:complete